MITTYSVAKINNCEILISRRPSSGEELQTELEQLRGEGVELVISLLKPDEVLREGLSNEGSICKSLNIGFLSFPITDQSIPGFRKFVAFIDQLEAKTTQLNKLLIHCSAGIGRSGLIALGLRLKQGEHLQEAAAEVSKIRKYEVPQSASQRKLLANYEGKLGEG